MGKVALAVGLLTSCVAIGVGCSVEEPGTGPGAAGADDGGAGAAGQAGHTGGGDAPQGGHAGSAGHGGGAAGSAGMPDTAALGGAAGDAGAAGAGGNLQQAGATANGGADDLLGGAGAGGAPGTEPVAGPASVSVLELDGAPLAGESVVFYDSHGENPVIVLTDANGKATHDVVSKSFITVALARPLDATFAYRYLTTFFDTEPGDDLVVRDERSFVPEEGTGTFSVSFPAVAQAVSYAVILACREGGRSYFTQSTMLSVSMFPSCLDASGHLTLVGVAYDNLAKVLAFSTSTGLSYVENGNVAMPSWQAANTYDLTLVNPPNTVQQVVVDASFRLGALGHYDELGSQQELVPSLLHLSAPPAAVDWALQTIEAVFKPATAGSAQSMRKSREPASGAHNVDLATLLPRLTSATVTTDANGLPHASFQADSLLDGAQGAFVGNKVTKPSADGVAGHWDELTWMLIAPPPFDAELSPPALPPELAAYAGSVDSPFTIQVVNVTKSTTLGSFAGLRHEAGRSLNPRGFPLTLPSTGSFVSDVTYLFP